jgi:hypothetical protein
MKEESEWEKGWGSWEWKLGKGGRVKLREGAMTGEMVDLPGDR